uniref:F-box domain-containing protein n=1 Tax=Meloidogyne enterolobii TaxID=390850 RepID=A0A6V7VNH5_MELEN|nr:unnamed protein product [Meloidogyne enterolobii]
MFDFYFILFLNFFLQILIIILAFFQLILSCFFKFSKMLFLPPEVQLDIFKFLSYEELCSIEQTNLYFRDFINNFDGELARQKLPFRISFPIIDQVKDTRKLIKAEAENIDFPLNERFEEKLKNELENPIPLYSMNQDLENNIFTCLSKEKSKIIDLEYCHILQLPTIITNKNQMKIVYYYLNKLFNCSFECGRFPNFIFNPKLIQLLFGNSRQIYINDCTILILDYNIENRLQFISNHLASANLKIYFWQNKDIMGKYINMLVKILASGGDKFKEVDMSFHTHSKSLDIVITVTMLYDQIIEYIATSSDCSKMVPNIIITYINSTSHKLNINKRAEKVEIKQLYGLKCTKYQIVNIYNPKVRFEFCHKKVCLSFIHIDKIKE